MKMKNWLVVGVLTMASSLASALTAEIAGNKTVVLLTKMTTPAKVILADATDTYSCTEGFILGTMGDDFTKNSLTVVTTARAVNGALQVDYDDTTCEVINVMLKEVP